MAFTPNDGEFDLGAGYIGRGTILGGEAYAVGTATTGVQGLINTAGLEGISLTVEGGIDGFIALYALADIVFFRSSDDPLTGTITATSARTSASTAWSFLRDQNTNNLSSEARCLLAPYAARTDTVTDDVIFSVLNSRDASTAYVQAPVYANNQDWKPLFRTASNWRFLARDHQTALVHYPSTAEEGAVFAASCVNSATQWGWWCAGEVGERLGYFNRIQGTFAITFLANGATTYFSAYSPQAADSTTRNDAPTRHSNIIPEAGQTTVNDLMSELVIRKDQGGGYSYPIGKVPGCFYVDPNKSGFDAYAVGDPIDINPQPNATFEGRDRALIVARWGSDTTITVSNTGSTFTVTSASPNRRTLEDGRRIQMTTIAPTGMAIDTDYWVINWSEQTPGSETGTFTFELASTETGSAITPSSNETGVTLSLKAALIAMRCY